jgi:prevent-host-death family protein
MTQVMKASEARKAWSQVLNKVFRGQTRVIVEKSGIPVAAVISAEDLQRLTILEEQRKERFKALERIREAFQDVPAETVEQEVAKALAQVRAEQREKRRRNDG